MIRRHRHSGLFEDPRNRGLTLAVIVSLVLHAGLMLSFGRFHIRPVERTFYAPMHMVDLVQRFPGAGNGAGRPKAPPAARPKPKPTPEPRAKPAPKPKPAPEAKPRPEPRAVAVPAQTGRSEAVPAEPAAAPENPELLEQRVAQRIARLRSRIGDHTPAPAKPDTGGEERVSRKIAALRERLTAQTGGAEASGAAGINAGANVLQQVRLRAYYNRLWDHVKEHWAVPPGVQGRGLTVIVSVVMDRSGRLLDTTVEESSGSEAFDRSALQALERAQPLPPVPEAVPGETLDIGFRFHGE